MIIGQWLKSLSFAPVADLAPKYGEGPCMVKFCIVSISGVTSVP